MCDIIVKKEAPVTGLLWKAELTSISFIQLKQLRRFVKNTSSQLLILREFLSSQKDNGCKQPQKAAEIMCDHSDSLAKDMWYTHPVKVSADHLDQWSVLDNIDEETLKKLISDFGLELQHDLPELKGPLHLTMNTTAEDEEPDR